jgi:hypothetical protein
VSKAATLALTALLPIAAAAAMAAQPVTPEQQSAARVHAAQDPALGRLFFTPPERERLDQLRRTPPAPTEVAKQAAPPQAPPPPQPHYVTVNGIVRRSDGESTVWLNNKPVQGEQASEGLVVTKPNRATAPGHVTLQVPESGRRVEIKVGQQVEVHSGTVLEAQQRPTPAAVVPKPRAQTPREETASRTAVGSASREERLLRDLLSEIQALPIAPPAQPAKSTAP